MGSIFVLRTHTEVQTHKGSLIMIFDTQIISAVIAAVVALIIAVPSVIYSRQAARSAKDAANAQLIGQLYTIYQSDEMLHDLQIVWKIYHRLWAADKVSKEEAIKKANEGVPVREDLAIKYFMKLKENSSEFKAIHRMINFWTYVELLLKDKALKPKQILAFTSPRILGFLCPMARAYEDRYPPLNDEKEEAVLEYAYKVLYGANSERLLRRKNTVSQ